MRVLVTGGSGFVGSHTVRALLRAGAEIAVLLRSPNSCVRLEDVLTQVKVIHGDLAALSAAWPEIEAFAPEAIAHLAWDGVMNSAHDDLAQAANVGRSIELMEWGLRAGIRCFVGLGSQAEYGPCSARIRENQPTRPVTLYGVSKLATGQVLGRMASVMNVPFSWLRLFSSYGPDDDPAWMMSYLIDTLLDGSRPSLTACEQVWDYIFVEDAARAIVAAIEHSASGTFNLGAGRGVRLADIVTQVRDLIDPNLPLGFGERPYGHRQVMHLEADITALVEATGWQPQVPLAEGLKSTVEGRKRFRLRSAAGRARSP